MEFIRQQGRGMCLLVAVCLLSGCGEGGTGNAAASASSQPASVSAPTANVLFKSNFDPGVSLGVPYAFATGGTTGYAWQDITGPDHETGYTWPPAIFGASFTKVQLITVDPVTASNVGDYVTAEIRQVPGPTGSPVYELFQNVKIKSPVGHGGTQAPLVINRPWTVGDVNDFYVTYWFKHQADLLTQLDTTVQTDGSVGNWRTLFEFKTGGYNNLYGGDYRITTYVMKDRTDGTLYWQTNGDNQANGAYDAAHKVIYWTAENRSVPVPIDQWFKFEGYWHRSGGADGRYWAAVNGQVIVDHHGPNMGDFGLPITRIFLTNPYSGGHTPVETHMTGLEIWDGFPCGDGTPCYK